MAKLPRRYALATRSSSADGGSSRIRSSSFFRLAWARERFSGPVPSWATKYPVSASVG